MNIVSLNEIKAQIRLEGNDEDTLLTMYGDSAEALALNMLNRDLASITEEYTTVPVPIKHAILIMVTLSYETRTPLSAQNLYAVPYSVDALLKPYMIL